MQSTHTIFMMTMYTQRPHMQMEIIRIKPNFISRHSHAQSNMTTLQPYQNAAKIFSIHGHYELNSNHKLHHDKSMKTLYATAIKQQLKCLPRSALTSPLNSL